MNWSDYESVWKRQELPTGAAADVAHIRATIEIKRQKFRGTLLVRDMTEGLLLILGVSLVFVRDFLRRRRLRIGPEAALLTKLDAEIAELQHQRRFLSHIGLWYFLPYLAALPLIYIPIFLHLGVRLPSDLLITLLTTPRSAVFIYLIVAIVVCALVLVWRDARDAGKKRINPRIEELERMRRDLFGSADNPGS